MKSVLLLPLACAVALVSPLTAQDASAAKTPAPAEGAVAAQARPAMPNTLMDGTPVSLRLAETISSADAHVGQTVPFEVTEDVVVQGVTVIAKGGSAIATVTAAEPKKRMGRGGKLDVNIDSVRLVDGSKVQLSAVKNTKGGGHVGVMTGAMVATGLVFFPAAPLFLFMHGKDITIPKGTAITAFVQGDTRLDMARLTGKTDTKSPAASAAVSSGTNTATLQIDCSAPAAEIEIDGAFAGNTPSTLSVAPGQHTITVRKKGFLDWTRTMNVSGTAVRVNADLEATQ